MRSAVVLLIAVAVTIAARSLHEDEVAFKSYQQHYNKHYAPSELQHRFKCFRRVLELIDERNAKDTAVHGINQYTDMCPEEFASKYLSGLRPKNSTNRKPSALDSPKNPQVTIDWRNSGAVTPIKDQGACGACWAFSATANIESRWQIAGNTLVSLSDGELNQCSTNGINDGCEGGWMDDAFDWVISNGGQNSEANYPYTSGNGVTGSCRTSLISTYIAKIRDYDQIVSSESSMATYLSKSPISVAVDASTWQTYRSGIMSNCPAGQINHGVVIVGAQTTASSPYWIIKNSWGTTWGQAGYMQLAYGSNQCYITAAPSSSVV